MMNSTRSITSKPSNTMKDKNLISISGDDTGNIWISGHPDYPENFYLFTAEQLRNRPEEIRLVMVGDIVLPDGSYADALKISGVVGLTVRVVGITGGSEDCIDINHSRNVSIEVGILTPRGRYAATIKGSKGISIRFGQLIGHGSVTDFDLGNWSDQDNSKTEGVELVAGTDHKSIKVRVLNSTNPVCDGQKFEVSVPWWRSFFLPVMKLLKKLRLA